MAGGGEAGERERERARARSVQAWKGTGIQMGSHLRILSKSINQSINQPMHVGNEAQGVGMKLGDHTDTEARFGGGLPAGGSRDKESWGILKLELTELADELEEPGHGGKSWEGSRGTFRVGLQRN